MNGKGEIFIKTRQKGDWVIVDLEDNGPGIPDDIRERIFSPFFTT
ncbi:MAG: ATP-binding protein, partial [Anaerolineales bacterium]|nr:ATP-binding protein [Anaerolineales bacterium]